MAPRQVFPYDEGGGGLRASSRHLLISKWADARTSVENAPPFAPPLPLSHQEEEVCKQPRSSDLHDALNDDDDDDGEGSVDLGSTWAIGREFVPKRGVEIFVGGLTRSTRRDMLRDWFQHAGEVTEVRIARDKRRRRCRGYGYVRFATSEQANRAIDTMHRFEFKHGRFLGVLPSDENRTLFVGGLREEWSCEYISQLLKEKMPGLRKVEPIPDREDRFKIRTFCFLEFASHAEAAVVFDRHHTTPRPPPQTPQHTATTNSSSSPTGFASLELVLPFSAYAGRGGGGGGCDSGDGVFAERDTRERSTSTCTTSCASNGGGNCCKIVPCCCGGGGGGDENGPGSAATAPTSASPVLRGSGALRFDGNCLRGRQHLGMEDNHGGGGGSSFCRWDEETAASSATPAVDGGEFGDNGAGGGGVEIGGDVGEAGAGTGGTVPLVVGGATLKVDWADPLRYHIHLNGGIKGPSASPELGMLPDGRPCSRGDGGGFQGARLAQPGGGAQGNVRATGGRSGIGSYWQQQQQQQQQQQRCLPQEQQQALMRQPPSLPPDPRWQDGGHPARMANQGLQHQREQQPQHQRCLDVSRDRHSPHVPHNGGVLRVPMRERGYTIAAGYATSRRSPFDANVHGGGGDGGGGRSVASQQHSRYASDRPRSKSSHFHASLAAVAVAAVTVPPEQQDYVDAPLAIPSVFHRDHHRQVRLQPHPALAAGGSPAGSRDRPAHTASDMVSLAGRIRGGGMHDGGGSSTQHHHHHHYHPRDGGGGDGGGAANRDSIPTGRPYSASPDISAGRHGRREAFSVGYRGEGNGDGNGNNMPPSRSASCLPFSEHQHQHQQVVGGAGGSRRATALLRSPPPPLEHHASVEDNASLGILDRPGSDWEELSAVAPYCGVGQQRHMASASLQGSGHLSGTASSVFDGHRSQRKQHQRGERPGARDRATDASGMVQDRIPPPPLDGGGGRDIGNSHRYTAADLATFDPRSAQQQQQQQQQQSERFSNTIPAASQPHIRRHTVAAGLDLSLGIGGPQDRSASNPPPGLSASRAAVDAWGAPAFLPSAATAAAAVVRDGAAADMRLGAGLWDSMGAGGLDRQERSSWPSALLSPGEAGAGENPWGS